jgi:hypothetical protein
MIDVRVGGGEAIAQPQRAGEQLDHLPWEDRGRAGVLVQECARTAERAAADSDCRRGFRPEHDLDPREEAVTGEADKPSRDRHADGETGPSGLAQNPSRWAVAVRTGLNGGPEQEQARSPNAGPFISIGSESQPETVGVPSASPFLPYVFIYRLRSVWKQVKYFLYAATLLETISQPTAPLGADRGARVWMLCGYWH